MSSRTSTITLSRVSNHVTHVVRACGCFALALAMALPASGAGWPWSRKPKPPTFTDEKVAELHAQQPNVAPANNGIGMPEQPSTTSKIASALNPAKAAKSVGNSVKSGTSKLSAAMKPKPKPKQPSDANSKKSWFSKDDDLSPEFYVSIARVQEQAGSFDLAAEQYEKALARDKRNLEALLGYARLLDRQGKFALSTEYYLRAVKAHPDNAAAANDLGLCYARQGKYNESLASLNKAVELDPKRDLYRNNIAAVLVEQNRINEAVGHIAAVYNEPVAHYNVGMMLHKRGQREAAAQQFSIALQKNPSLEPARQWLAQIQAEQQHEHLAMRQPPYAAPPVASHPMLDHGATQSRHVGVAGANGATVPSTGAAFMQPAVTMPPAANGTPR